MLTSAQRQIRQNIRNFLMTATTDELYRELELSRDMKDSFRTQCVQELIDEHNKCCGICGFPVDPQEGCDNCQV